MENEEKNEGVAVSEVMHLIGRKIWYILGAAAVFTVLAVLLLVYVICPLFTSYSLDFRLVFPTEGDAVYPDGSPFFYQDMISSSFLSEAKASDPKFSGIDAEKMLKNGDITIVAETVTENNVIKYTGRYTVSVKGSYFGDGDLAQAFIEAIANVPVNLMRNAAENVKYDSEKEIFESAPFEERIALLGQEKENLLAVYDGWIDIYSETFSVRINGENGVVIKRLKDFRDSVSALFGESVRKELENELEFGGYYSGDLAAYTAQLKLEYAQNEAEIERIREAIGNNAARGGVLSASEGSGDGYTAQPLNLSQRLAELINRNIRIDHWVNASGNVENPTLTEENVTRFAARLAEEFEKLNSEAKQLTNVIGAIYARGMSAHFDAQKATSSGEPGVVIGGVVSFIVSFAVGTIAVYAIESKKKKQKAAEETAD